MADQRFEVPSLWADHHVLALREALASLPGVQHVAASSLDRQVTVVFDPAQTDAAALAAAMTAAGYPAGAAEAAAESGSDKPEWATAGLRVTRTDPLDLSMSGDYRKY